MSLKSFVAVLMVLIALPSAAAAQDGSIYRWNGRAWMQVDGFGVRLSVAPDGSPWVLNSNNEIWRSTSPDGIFEKLPGTAKDIGIGGDGRAWIIGTDDGIYRWNGNAWDRVQGTALAISVDQTGTPWVINTSAEIYRWNGDRFVKMHGTGRDIGAGTDVWIVGTDRQIYRFDTNTNDWTPMGGSGDRVSAGQGTAWVVNPGGEIYRYAGRTFERVNGSARDIAANANGDVWMVGTARVGRGGFRGRDRDGSRDRDGARDPDGFRDRDRDGARDPDGFRDRDRDGTRDRRP